MFAEQHDLHHEFPEFNDQIHKLKMSDGHFQRLFTNLSVLNKLLKHLQMKLWKK